VVFTAHGWAFSEGVPFSQRLVALPLEKLVSLVSDRIVCVSRYDYDLALRSYVALARQMVIVHYGIEDVPSCLWSTPAQPGPAKIIMVARFSPQKNQMDLLSAFSALKGNPTLIFVGDGPLLEKCRAKARILKLTPGVQFLGERHDVADLLAQSHIAVLSSNWEGLPISILEAMRAGLPVVATRVGGVPELVEDGITGYLVPPHDPRALATALQRLLDSPEDRHRMGQRGREKMLRQFSVECMVAKTLEVYRDVLEGRRPLHVAEPG
jgi:glycosyltransferase involved in cell wall biosynthesis